MSWLSSQLLLLVLITLEMLEAAECLLLVLNAKKFSICKSNRINNSPQPLADIKSYTIVQSFLVASLKWTFGDYRSLQTHSILLTLSRNRSLRVLFGRIKSPE